jgi:hypothetical protein
LADAFQLLLIWSCYTPFTSAAAYQYFLDLTIQIGAVNAFQDFV